MRRRQPIRTGALLPLVMLAASLCACGGGSGTPATGPISPAPTPTPTPADPGPTPTAVPGEPLVQGKPVSAFFQDSCSGCHGVDRRGATGPALLPARLTDSDDYYFGVIERGKPDSIMPPWGGFLADAEIATIVAFLRTEPPGGAPTWTMQDVADSLEVLADESTLPDRPTHAGNLDNLFLVTERESQKIAAIDGDTHTLLGEIPASYRAHGYTFSPADERWAYNVGRDGWVFKIDLYTLAPVRKVRIGIDSRAVAISDDGKVLIAGNYIPASAVLLDAGSLQPLAVVDTTATNPEGETVASRVATILDTSPAKVGPYFLVALKEAGQVWRIDWSKPQFPIVKLEKVGHVLHDGFLSPDNRSFYLASQSDDVMAVVDVADMTLRTRIGTGDKPHPGSGATWEAGGATYGATVHAGEGRITIWDLDGDAIAASITTPGPGLFLRAQDDSPYVWADSMFAREPHAITVFEKTPPFAVVGVLRDGLRTLHPEFTADGRHVYVPDWDGNVVRVYDARSLERVAEITGITAPTGIFNSHRREETLGH